MIRPGTVLVALALLTGCKGSDVALYGQERDTKELVTRSAALTSQVADGDVTVRGTVGEVCPAGCWFMLLGEDTLAYVQLDAGRNFVIPHESTGKSAVVEGALKHEAGRLLLVARTVILTDPKDLPTGR